MSKTIPSNEHTAAHKTIEGASSKEEAASFAQVRT